ncbi:hypothetical protein [Pseudomonas citronellolis]|uniref:hypothetical protein n=1 Tax=Pseudomonas citronellolis TaxID=53408 RepID=UPI0021C1297B|nr:hypothetical protein [Pseudomonas citronellolis]UXJ50096.1 hypothetical protein N5P21_19105 [Pseudomonas citronellolis]
MTEHLHSELEGISTLAGSPKEIRRQLANTDDGQVVAVTIEHGTQRAVRALQITLTSLAALVDVTLVKHDRQTLETIVEALVPIEPPRPALLREAAMVARARTAILKGADWLTASEIAGLAGFSASNPSAQPNKWKREGAIFALRHHGVDYFPGYGLDPLTGYRPAKAMAEVLKVFYGSKDSWALAGWFQSVNSFLGGRRPQDLLTSEPERVIAAAQDEMEGIAHG